MSRHVRSSPVQYSPRRASRRCSLHSFAFAGASDDGRPGGQIDSLCRYLETGEDSPVLAHTRPGEDIDSVINLRAIFQQHFRTLEHVGMPNLLRPGKGAFGLCDYEKVYCSDLKAGEDIFEMRGIDRERGCIVIVRPDQYVAHILPLTARSDLAAFFGRFLLPR